MITFRKDPDAVLDYKFDWSTWLPTGDTIATATVTASTGLTVDSSSITDSGASVTAWLSGGTVGAIYTLTCRIVTDQGRTEDRAISIRIEQR